MVQVARSADGSDCAITVRPNNARPRGGDGPCLLLASVSAGSLAGLFWQIGAWPVTLFLLASVAALAAAMVLSRQRAGQYDRLVFHDRLLRIERHRAGRDEQQEVNAHWVRIGWPGASMPRGFCLRVHGHALPLGSFLAPHEQRRLARLVAGELARLDR